MNDNDKIRMINEVEQLQAKSLWHKKPRSGLKPNLNAMSQFTRQLSEWEAEAIDAWLY